MSKEGKWKRGRPHDELVGKEPLPVAVLVVLLVVEAAVLEGLVPFLVPVTNSICPTHRQVRYRSRL